MDYRSLSKLKSGYRHHIRSSCNATPHGPKLTSCVAPDVSGKEDQGLPVAMPLRDVAEGKIPGSKGVHPPSKSRSYCNLYGSAVSTLIEQAGETQLMFDCETGHGFLTAEEGSSLTFSTYAVSCPS